MDDNSRLSAFGSMEDTDWNADAPFDYGDLHSMSAFDLDSRPKPFDDDHSMHRLVFNSPAQSRGGSLLDSVLNGADNYLHLPHDSSLLSPPHPSSRRITDFPEDPDNMEMIEQPAREESTSFLDDTPPQLLDGENGARARKPVQTKRRRLLQSSSEGSGQRRRVQTRLSDLLPADDAEESEHESQPSSANKADQLSDIPTFAEEFQTTGAGASAEPSSSRAAVSQDLAGMMSVSHVPTSIAPVNYSSLPSMAPPTVTRTSQKLSSLWAKPSLLFRLLPVDVDAEMRLIRAGLYPRREILVKPGKPFRAVFRTLQKTWCPALESPRRPVDGSSEPTKAIFDIHLLPASAGYLHQGKSLTSTFAPPAPLISKCPGWCASQFPRHSAVSCEQVYEHLSKYHIPIPEGASKDPPPVEASDARVAFLFYAFIERNDPASQRQVPHGIGIPPEVSTPAPAPASHHSSTTFPINNMSTPVAAAVYSNYASNVEPSPPGYSASASLAPTYQSIQYSSQQMPVNPSGPAPQMHSTTTSPPTSRSQFKAKLIQEMNALLEELGDDEEPPAISSSLSGFYPPSTAPSFSPQPQYSHPPVTASFYSGGSGSGIPHSVASSYASAPPASNSWSSPVYHSHPQNPPTAASGQYPPAPNIQGNGSQPPPTSYGYSSGPETHAPHIPMGSTPPHLSQPSYIVNTSRAWSSTAMQHPGASNSLHATAASPSPSHGMFPPTSTPPHTQHALPAGTQAGPTNQEWSYPSSQPEQVTLDSSSAMHASSPYPHYVTTEQQPASHSFFAADPCDGGGSTGFDPGRVGNSPSFSQ